MKKLSLNEMANIQAKGISQAVDVGCAVFTGAGILATAAGVALTGVGTVVAVVVGVGCISKWGYDWFTS
ncbi:MAG: hypothetical protein MUE81_05950 [Thermoflexibacter sp.]|jgi:hypothetical protein|nr:hypothetical protein [Thermoflexibacter sp.]